MIDTVRLSESAKRRLTNLKRLTGIEQWNILSRWALCVSLSENSIPPAQDNESLSSIEMTWKVFAGHHSDAYLAVVLNEYNVAKESGFALTESEFVRHHIEWGIATLVNKLRKNKLPALIELGTKAA